METILHKSDTRGSVNLGWLQSKHTFSFGSYYNPSRMQFGLLRVLNDDVVIGGAGFGTHPHDNMEIVSIPLKGSLEHQDTMGNSSVIRTNDVQIMSAGRGLKHSEYNHSKDEEVNFLQIWVFPQIPDIKPRYEQKTFNPQDRKNKIQTVVSPDKDNGALWINQNAYFSLGTLDAGTEASYKLHTPDTSGVYVFLIDGELTIDGITLDKRDGLGILEAKEFEMTAKKNCEVLLIEVPVMDH